MKQGRSIEDVLKEVERQRQLKEDYIADTREMRMILDEEKGYGYKLQLSDTGEFRISETPHQQIAEFAGIPSRYYNRLRQEAPELLLANIDYWFKQTSSRRMVRTMGDQVRAFLSDRYRRLDNEDLVQSLLLPMFATFSELAIMSCEITDNRLYIKAVTNQLSENIDVGDIIYGGVVMSNSEVGKGSLRIEPLIYRLVCRNGMIMPDYGLRKYHIGNRLIYEDAYITKLSDETIAADDIAFWLKARDILRATLSEDVFGRIVERLKEAKEDKITADPIRVVERLSKKQLFNTDEQNTILRYLLGHEELTRFGLSNAVTRTAQIVSNYDRATELEYSGAEIITMSSTEWNAIAEHTERRNA